MPISRLLDYPFLLMADQEALSLLYNASMGYASAIEKRLEILSLYVLTKVKRNFELIYALGVISQ